MMSHKERKQEESIGQNSRALWHLEVKTKKGTASREWVSVYCEVEENLEVCGFTEGKRRINFEKEQEVNYTDSSWEVK